MTAQSMELIFIDGQKLWMASEPFNQYLRTMDTPPELIWPDTACWRGYHGCWKIEDDKLFLTDLEAFIKAGGGCEKVGMDYFFPAQKQVFAEWVTGILHVPRGKQIHYVHMGYESVYERDLFIRIDAGKVVGRNEVKNT